MFSRFLKIDCNLPVINKIRGYKMKNFKRVILMISMFAITGASVNCSFRSRLERRSARIRENGGVRTNFSSILSRFSRSAVLMFNRFVPEFMEVDEFDNRRLNDSTQSSISILQSNRELSEFTNLTGHDSEQIISVLNGNHEKQAEFSGDFEEFLYSHFTISNDSVISFDMKKIANTLTPSTNFYQLRSIYLDSIFANIEFIRNLFEDVFFLELNIKYLDSGEIFYISVVPLANFLRSNLFANCFEAVDISNKHLGITTNNEEDLCIYYDCGEDVVNGLMFDFNIEQELDGLENIIEYLQIDSNFIVECFIRDIENSDLESIERFVRFVEQNVEENEALEIFKRCLNILNPENYDAIVEGLSNVRNGALSLRFLNITIEQLAFLIPFLKQVEYLSLSGNELTELPAEIGQLRNLRFLMLDSNRLTELPDSIGNLTNIEDLFVNNNQLTELPESIGNLTSLTSLRLFNNELTELPAEIGQLTSLENLYLAYNRLTALPDSIGNLTNIEDLFVNNNQLTELPVEIGQLRNLRRLDLIGTSIEGFKEFYRDREEVQGFMNLYFNR